MNAVVRWAIMAVVVLLVGCISRGSNTELTDCTYPDSPRTPAPEFICNAQMAGFPVIVLRSDDRKKVEVSERIDQLLQRQINDWAQQFSLQWFRDAETQRRAQQYLLQELNDKARVVRSRMSPKEKLWILIGLPYTESALQAQTRAAMSAS